MYFFITARMRGVGCPHVFTSKCGVYVLILDIQTNQRNKMDWKTQVSQTCPSCGVPVVVCSFKDNSDQSHINDWVFEFSYSCTSCGFHKSKTVTLCYDYETEEDHICPFCGRNWFPKSARS